MGAYLIDNPPAISQFSPRTNWSPSRPTGLTVLHTAEGVMDTVGPDTGAEAVANFIRTRTTYGSYHDLVDSDSIINLVPYNLGAYQDGTGSNGCALSISFACSTTDWNRMSPERRRAFLMNGARAFVRQQAWLKSNGYPMTPLRMISKAESDRGLPGLIYHAHRDPARRSDPGVIPPNLFPLSEFIGCILELSDGEEDIMATKEELKALLMETIPAALIAPSPGGIGGGEARSLQAMLGRLLDDADGANKKAALILSSLSDAGTIDLADEDVAQIVTGLASKIPDVIGRLSNDDVERIAQASADEQARRLGS